MARPPVSEQVQVNFRMPVDLRDRIRAASESNNRSLNAEIVAALEEKYPALDLDIDRLLGGEMLYFITTTNAEEAQARVDQINQQLAGSPRHRDLEVRLLRDDGGPHQLIVSRRLRR